MLRQRGFLRFCVQSLCPSTPTEIERVCVSERERERERLLGTGLKTDF